MEHEVFVPVPADHLAAALADPDRVALALPGLQRDAAAEGVAGRLKLRVGGSSVTYRGSLGVTRQDDGTFTAEGVGGEARGDGTVRVTVRVTLRPRPDGTVLHLAATGSASGRITGFDPDAVRSALTRLMERFAADLPGQSGENADDSGGGVSAAVTADGHDEVLPGAGEPLVPEFAPAADGDFDARPDAEDPTPARPDRDGAPSREDAADTAAAAEAAGPAGGAGAGTDGNVDEEGENVEHQDGREPPRTDTGTAPDAAADHRNADADAALAPDRGEAPATDLAESPAADAGEDPGAHPAADAREGTEAGPGEPPAADLGEDAAAGSGRDPAPGAGKDTEAGPGGNGTAHAGENAAADTGEDAEASSGEGTAAQAGEGTEVDTAGNPAAGAGEDAGSEVDPVDSAPTDTGEDVAADPEQSTAADPGADAEAHSGEDTGADAEAHSGADTGADAEADPGEDAEADPAADAGGGDDGARRSSVFDVPIPPPSLDPAAEFDEVDGEDPLDFPGEDAPVADAAQARRTMIGRSAEEVDHAPPRGRYAPVPVPPSGMADRTLRWAGPAAAALAVAAGAIAVTRALRRGR
ncbi:SRPBCC family protein [Streptomyces sp. NPDC002644]